jgi:dihydroflavonol-4-reductase
VAVLVSHGTAYADENFLRQLHSALRNPQSAIPNPPSKILLFGPSAHFVAEPWLAEGLADAALLGEPEGAIVDAIERLAVGKLGLPPGLGGWGGLADLDALPFPAWDLIPWQPYAAVSLLSSRGCPAGCAYCAYTVAQGRTFRAQSPERTVAELAWLAETIRPPLIQVRDPVFAHDRARVVAICVGILACGLQLSFACESRPEHFDDELLALLARAGCATVKIGLESADPALLARLGRVADQAAAEYYVAEAGRVARTSQKLGIICQLFVMAGLPGQDAAALARTEAFLRRLPAETQVRAKPYQAHPGTPLLEPSAPVAAETLSRLEQANRPPTPVWRRVLGWVEGKHRIGTDKRIETPRSETSPASPLSSVAISVASFPPTRVFLTGGNGFVGGHVARALIAAGMRVVALVRPGSPLGALADLPAEGCHPGLAVPLTGIFDRAGFVEIVRGDLMQPSAWAEMLQGCDVCFHVAALYGGAEQAAAMYAVNAGGTSALLAACKAAGVRRVIYTGTIGTVGRPAGATALCKPDETTPFNLWDQASHYVRSKYLGELTARSWNGAGLEVVIVKPTATVGAGDARPSATGRRILAALHGEVTPYPPGGVNHVPVRDVAAGHLLAAQSGVSGRTYILGHKDGNLDHAGFLRLVAEAAGKEPLCPPRHPVTTAGLPAALTADPSRAIRELGMPQSDLCAAFKEAVEWFATFGSRFGWPAPG